MGATVGIDLGTTNSVVAWVDRHGKPVVVPNRDGAPITPSVICFHDSEVLVGDAAKEMQALGQWPVAAFFKRQIGDALFIFHANGVDYSATDLSAIVLRRLKEDAEAALGERVQRAVITVPAYFRDAERKATIAAGTAAGLEVLQVINEPTAAAIAYGAARRQDAEKRLLVYDLGGGTFDVTVLSLKAGEIRVLNSVGDHQLGGKDWDDRIIAYLATSFQDEFGVDPLQNAESVADLLVRAEDAKKRLSTLETAALTLTHDGEKGRYQLSRATFEELTADLMERTVSLTQRALEDVELKPADIDGALLVGGSTRMPMVHRFLEQTFGKPPMGGINVDEAVALGAALVTLDHQASARGKGGPLALAGPVKTFDVTNHSLGMIALNGDRSAYLNSIILPKNTPIPSTETRPYQHRTRSRGDNELEIYMTQGETESPADVSYTGRYVVHDVPHQSGGITVVDVEYRYDVSGTVQVAARARGAAQPLKVTVEAMPPDVPDRFLRPPDLAALEVREHLTAYLVFDLSGSMTGAPLRQAKKAARGFLTNSDLSHCSIGVIAVSDNAKVMLKACQDARQIERAIERLQVGDTGYGNDGHPFDEIFGLLKKVEGRRYAIVLADGVWEDQRRAIKQAKRCHEAEIDVIAVGFGQADREFLRAIASSDEGSFFTSLNDLVETFSTIAQVLSETGGAKPEVEQPKQGEKRPGFFASLRERLG